jgi:hypothetical protein
MWVGIKNLGKEGYRYIRQGGKTILKTGQKLLTKDFWINAGKQGLKTGRKFLQLSTYRDFIKANPGIVLTITTTIGVALGSKLYGNEPGDHFKPFGVNIGFGVGGLLGGIAGFVVGAGILALAGVSAPAIAIAAGTALAVSAASFAFWSLVEWGTGVQAKQQGETEEAMLKRVKAIVDKTPDEFLEVATAKDFQKFVKGGKKSNEKFQAIEESLQKRLEQMLNDGEFSEYAKKFPVKGSDGKRNMSDWYKKFTDTELELIFSRLLTYKGKPKSPKKGGARTVIEITPLDDLFDLVLLIIYMHHLKYINKGYPVDLTRELILIEYYSAIMPILHVCLNFNFEIIHPNTIFLAAVEFPYSFLVFKTSEYLQVNELLDMTRGENVTIRRLTVEEIKQRYENPDAYLLNLIRQADEAEGRLPAQATPEIAPTPQVKPNITLQDDLTPPKTDDAAEQAKEYEAAKDKAAEKLDEIKALDEQENVLIRRFVKYSFLKKLLDEMLDVFNGLVAKKPSEKSSKTMEWLEETNSTIVQNLDSQMQSSISSIQKTKGKLIGALDAYLNNTIEPIDRYEFRDVYTNIQKKQGPLRAVYQSMKKYLRNKDFAIGPQVEKCHYDNKGYTAWGTSITVGRDDDKIILCLLQIITDQQEHVYADEKQFLNKEELALLKEILESETI